MVKLDKTVSVKIKAGLFQRWHPAEGDKELPGPATSD